MTNSSVTFCSTQFHCCHYPLTLKTNEVPLFTLDTFVNKKKRLRWREELLFCGGISTKKQDI